MSDGSESVPRGAPAREVRAMFARIAPTYDLLNSVLSARRDRAWRHATGTALDPNARRILDLCSGTGDLALAIAAVYPKAFVCAGDFCFEMLARGASKGLQRRAAPATVDALRLPFSSGVFDAVTAAFGVRNFEDLEAGLLEMRRVTRPGGQLACSSSSAASRRGATGRSSSTSVTCCRGVGALVSHDAGAYTYLPRSVGRFATRRQFAAALQQTGWTDIERREMTLGIATLFLARAG
jgi:demethylmenaquinone methyltransferase/2-methoxy-6-polyprenyl-1,4-benzoquinol methylase